MSAPTLETAERIWQSRLDCWYQPHREPGTKTKGPQREIVYLLHSASDSDSAVKGAIEWADSYGPNSKGRKMLKVEHRETGSVQLPLQLGRRLER